MTGAWYLMRNDRRVTALIGICASLLVLFAPASVNAHALGQSYLFLSIFEHSVEGRVEIPITDLNNALNLDLPTDRSLTETDLEPYIEEIKSYVSDRVQLSPNGASTKLRLTGYRLFATSFAQYLVLDFMLDGLVESPEYVDIGYALIFDVNPDHRGLSVIENNWKTSVFNNERNVSLTFSPTTRNQRLDLSSGSVLSGLIGMIQLGIHHIAIGLDHILFILALLLPSVLYRENGSWHPVSGFREALIHVVKIVTVFTIAHSISLSLAVLGAVEISSRLVESIIALSIMLVALDIIVPIFGRHVWWLVFVFGLFHGFGFASVLSEMGIHSNYTALTLLGFNVGVELGQLAIVCIAFPLLYSYRKYRFYYRLSLPYGATALILISSYWFIERAFEVDLPAGALANQLFGLFA